jgi:nucleotide-binding universal stress UspA family protein
MPVFCVPSATYHPGSADRPIPVIQRVLAATDLSDLGNHAIAHAYSLVRPGGTVELAYIAEHPMSGAPGYGYSDSAPTLSPEERAAVADRLLALVPTEARTLGISTNVHVIDGGDAAESIVQAAERLHVDVISIGAHGRGGFRQAILGSVATSVLQHTTKPVFAVRAAQV